MRLRLRDLLRRKPRWSEEGIYIRPIERGVCLPLKGWIDIEWEYGSDYYVIRIRKATPEEKRRMEEAEHR